MRARWASTVIGRMIGTAIGVALVAGTQAACTSLAAGTPTARAEDDRYGAPPVTDPLDASQFISRPCAVLTPAQLAGFKITKPGEPDTESGLAEVVGPVCVWKSDGGKFRSASAGIITGNTNGLADTYRAHRHYEFDGGYFEPTTVDGYPAVFQFPIDDRADGFCNITVGISQTLTFRADVIGSDAGACDDLKELAAAVLATMKASNG